MKKERKILLVLLLLFVCGLAFFVFVMFGDELRSPIAVQSKASKGEPLVTLFSNGEEIQPFLEPGIISVWDRVAETWIKEQEIQKWPSDKSVVSEFPVLTYADDFEIRYRDDVSCSEAVYIWDSNCDVVVHGIDKSYLSRLPAGTYYIRFFAQYHRGEWKETRYGAGYEESCSYQCLFTLIKED